MSNTTQTDIQSGSFIYKISPPALHPYLNLVRADRPVGTWLLFLPCVLGVLAAQNIAPIDGMDALKLIILFGFGSFFMRSAGCIINDIWDRDFDKAVERTKMRPLACGVLNLKQAYTALFFCLLGGAFILFQLNSAAIILGFLFLIPVILYPAAKRITHYPQFVLGITFNAGVLIGGTSVISTPSFWGYLPLVLIYIGTVFWTFGYDTVYARQDIEDDARIGIRSSALKFGKHIFEIVLCLYCIMAFCFAIGLYFLNAPFLSWGFYVLAFLHIFWNHYNWEIGNPVSALKTFKTHIISGVLLTLPFFIALMI